MINKQNLWFLTLFSLILVLSVYYITMPNDLLLNNNGATLEEGTTEDKEIAKENTDEVSATIEESEILVALRVDLAEQRETLKSDLQSILTNKEKTSEEKNEAYEQLKYLNVIVGEEEALEAKIKTTYQMDCFVEISQSEIKVVVVAKNHDATLANNIMRTIQGEYKEPKYITVQFK